MIESVELLIKQPGQADRVVRLPEGATRLGRAEDNEVVLSDVGVSRRHAQVYVSRGEVTVEDLGSGNGTYYNGYRVQSQPVQDGDEVVIDPFVLQFKVRGAVGNAPGASAAGGPPRADAGASGPPPARLEVVVGTGMAGSSYPITSRGLSVGRSEDRDVVIPDPAASRHHCQITLQAGEYVLRDMGSANGIFVNAVRVRECTLADGDLIRIGNTEMRFVRYDDGASDNTTQVVSSDGQGSHQPQWNEPAVAPMQQHHHAPRAIPEPAKRRSSRPLLAVLLGGMVLFVAMLVVLVVVLIVVVLVLRSQPSGPPQFAALAPRWELTLPPGLQSAPVTTLFVEGRQKMKEGQRKEALLDFYRVLLAEPGYLYVDKFAFAAGEYMVLDVLYSEFSKKQAAKAERDALREKLMRDVRTGSRSSRLAAERTLKKQFKDDPIVIQAMEWPASEEAVALEKIAADAADRMSANKYDEAVVLLEDLLVKNPTAATRKQALANLKTSQKEVARSSTVRWSDGVLKEASGARSDAKVVFGELAKDHPSNPSALAHLARLP